MRLSALFLCMSFASAVSATSVAHFDDFTYTGNDAYYNMRPLADSTEFYNPVIPGWNSDPSIVRVGNDYWLVVSTFGYFPGVPLYHSTDLAHWELVRNILDRPSQLSGLPGQSLDKGGIYAPHISYNPANGLFYMITTDVGKKEGHFYVTAKDPRGDWSEPTFLRNIDGIDPSFFFDEGGNSYIVYKEDTSNLPKWSPYRCIRFIRFDVEKGRTFGESWPLYEPDTDDDEHLDRAEGPHLYKIDGKYFLITAEGGTGEQHSANIYRAPSVYGPWTRSWRNPILTQRTLKPRRTNPVTCAGHADLVQTPGGDWWAVFLAQRPGPGGTTALGRETFLMPVRWSKDGYPYMTQAMDTVPMVLRREGIGKTTQPMSGNFTWKDDFDGNRLAAEWIGLRGSTENLRSIDGGALHLQCGRHKVSGRQIPAYVGRRIQHHAFSAETSMSFNPDCDCERAGLLIVKNESAYLFMCSDGERLRLIHGSKGNDKELASATLPPASASDRPIRLRVVSDGVKMTFSYRNDGDAGWTVLADDVDASSISCERTGGFTGATVGLYAVAE